MQGDEVLAVITLPRKWSLIPEVPGGGGGGGDGDNQQII